MPNRNYLAGRRCEYRVLKFYRALGWEAIRTAGSHGLIDVIAWQPGGPLHVVQVKRCKRPGASWKDANWRQLVQRAPDLSGEYRTFKVEVGATHSNVMHDETHHDARPRVYAFVYRHGKSAPEIYDSTGACEWAA